MGYSLPKPCGASLAGEDRELNAIDGTERTRFVGSFRELDRKRIQLARSEVLTTYLNRRPEANTLSTALAAKQAGLSATRGSTFFDTCGVHDRDFWVEPLFDEGWEVKKRMIGVICVTDLDDGEIAVD